MSASDIALAAHNAAAEIEEMLIAMLAAHELGEVAVVVGYNQLEPEYRPKRKGKAIRIVRGEFVQIETVTR